jgi:hypothetical protein
MQSCHIVVAVRLKTRMTGLRNEDEQPVAGNLRRPVSSELLQLSRMRCLYAISQLKERATRRIGQARTAVMRKRHDRLRFQLIHIRIIA